MADPRSAETSWVAILAGGVYPDRVGARVALLPARSDLVGGLLLASLFTLTVTIELIRTISPSPPSASSRFREGAPGEAPVLRPIVNSMFGR